MGGARGAAVPRRSRVVAQQTRRAPPQSRAVVQAASPITRHLQVQHRRALTRGTRAHTQRTGQYLFSGAWSATHAEADAFAQAARAGILGRSTSSRRDRSRASTPSHEVLACGHWAPHRDHTPRPKHNQPAMLRVRFRCALPRPGSGGRARSSDRLGGENERDRGTLVTGYPLDSARTGGGARGRDHGVDRRRARFRAAGRARRVRRCGEPLSLRFRLSCRHW